MLSQKMQMKISLVVHAMVTTHFSMMCNPVYQGNFFEWKGFKEMVVSHVLGQLFIYFREEKKVTKEMLDFAQDECERLCDKMLSNSGFLEEE
jgi:hypothetical protein